ncbi:MAG TPA: hypothetical protein VFQ58_09905, partial [Flavisolibacter sp.]|nr:hypothetical protein [Flavisolibacter sp.]
MNFKNIIPFFLSCLITTAAFCQDLSNIQFIENKGQWNKSVKFMGQVSNGAFFVTGNGFTVLQHSGDDLNQLHEITHNHNIKENNLKEGKPSITLHSHAYAVKFLNANSTAEIIPDKPLPGTINYFLGNDPSKWASGCQVFQGLTVKNVYPNVDVRYFSDKGMVKYDIIVNPGGKVSDIALKYDGVNKLDVKNKELVIRTSVGTLKELRPYTYQYNDKGRNEIDNKYHVKDNVVKFNIQDYNPNTTLIIDPSLIFCSFTGSSADNWGFTATYGPDGSMFGGGIVFSQGFPVSTGALQTKYGGGKTGGFEDGFDIGIIKLSPDGSSRIYATYIGGSGNEFPQSLIVDDKGELIIAGRSDSDNDYPLYPQNNNQNAKGSFDIVVTKLNASGTKLVGSVKIGGSGNDGANITPYGGGASSLQRNYGDEARSEVNLDGAGNIYVASCTQSSDFPIVNGFQKTNGAANGSQDGVVL